MHPRNKDLPLKFLGIEKYLSNDDPIHFELFNVVKDVSDF